MSYKALYRRYRPMAFDEVAGQQYIVETIKNSILNNRISHAYLFSGPRGIGKTSIARIIAKAVNCLNLHDGNPCNHCENCQSINDGSAVDVIEIDAASNNGVEEIRNLLERVNFLPASFKYKIYIIDEVHMLSTAAFNALLKTLEEPPVHVIFILATTEAYKVPATILSRCQRFDFQPIDNQDMLAQLQKVKDQENINITSEALEAVCEAAEGGMRDALSILDQVSSYKEGEITEDDVENVTGRVSTNDLLNLIKLIKEEKVSEALEQSEAILEKGKEVGVLIPALLSIYRDMLLYQTAKSIQKRIYNNEEFVALASQIKRSQIFKYIDILNDVQNKIKMTTTPKIYLEVGLVKMMSKDSSNQQLVNSDVDLTDIYARLANLETNNGKVEDSSLGEFKDYTKSKLDFLENVISKFSVQPQNLVERIEALEEQPSNLELERRVETLEKYQNQLPLSDEDKPIENNVDLTEVYNRLQTLENNDFDKKESSVDLSNIYERLNQLENNINNQNNEQNVLNQDNNLFNDSSIDLSNIYERLSKLEEALYNKEEPTDGNVDLTQIYNRLNDIELQLEGYNNIFVTQSDLQKLATPQVVQTNGESVDLSNIYKRLDAIERDINTPMNEPLPFDDEAPINNNDERISQIEEQLSLNDNAMDEINRQIDDIKLAIDELNKEDNEALLKQIDEKIASVKEYAIKLGSRITLLEEKEKEEVKEPQVLTKRPQPYETRPREDVNLVKEEVIEDKKQEEQLPDNQKDETARVYDVKIVENILHQSRDKRNIDDSTKISSVWSRLASLVPQNLTSVAQTLSEGKVVANGANYLLIIFNKASICNYLMTNQNHINAKQILRNTLQRDYDFIALPVNTWEEVRQDYKAQYHMGIKYPVLKPINNPELKVINITENSFQTTRTQNYDKVVEMFGKDLVKEVK